MFEGDSQSRFTKNVSMNGSSVGIKQKLLLPSDWTGEFLGRPPGVASDAGIAADTTKTARTEVISTFRAMKRNRRTTMTTHPHAGRRTQ